MSAKYLALWDAIIIFVVITESLFTHGYLNLSITDKDFNDSSLSSKELNF